MSKRYSKDGGINPENLKRKKRFLETREKLKRKELLEKIAQLKKEALGTKDPTFLDKIENKLQKYYELMFLFEKRGK